jgi:hypothetical protein
MRNSLVIIMIFLVFACSKNKLPKGILTEKEIAPVLVELHLGEAINTQQFGPEITRDNYQTDIYLSILKKFKLDQKVFETSVLYYSKHPDLYKPIYDEVLNRLNEMSVMSRAKDSIQNRNLEFKIKAKDSVRIVK